MVDLVWEGVQLSVLIAVNGRFSVYKRVELRAYERQIWLGEK